MAAATAPGRSALAIVRLSGPEVPSIRDALCKPLTAAGWRPGRTRRVELVDADGVFDDGVAVFQAAPRSFTGEHTLELTVHGNPLIVERTIAACLAVGAELAGPGAFTRRAVLSGKLSLVGAEGIDLTIRATSSEGLAVARAAPVLETRIVALRRQVVEVVAELEARLDYPADELALADDDDLRRTLITLVDGARTLASSHAIGRVLVDGARVALVGTVNAGKSSLFNRLVGRERALVSDRPGTTRDVVETRCRIGPLEVTLLDTAGERATDDPIEAAGLALAQNLIADADLLVVVLRGVERSAAEQEILDRTANRARLVVVNAIDQLEQPVPGGRIGVSALSGAGLGHLQDAVVAALIGQDRDPEAIVGTLRQAELLRCLADAAERALEGLDLAGVAVAAEELVDGLEAVDALTGAVTREDVLDALFARFCIGK